MTFLLSVLSSLFLSVTATAEGNFEVSYELVATSTYDAKGEVVERSLGLLKTRIHIDKGYVILNITPLEEGKEKQEIKFVKLDSESWGLELSPTDRKPVLSESRNSFKTFKVITGLGANASMVQTFSRLDNGTTKIVTQNLVKDQDAPESTTVVEGRAITEQEYTQRLRAGPVKRKPPEPLFREPPQPVKSEEITTFELLEGKGVDKSNLPVTVGTALLKTKMDLPLGWVEHTVTYLTDEGYTNAQTYRFVRRNADTWELESNGRRRPIIAESVKEYKEFKLIDTFPNGSRLIQTFERRPDGTTAIGGHKYETSKGKPNSVVYEGKLITEKEYLELLKTRPVVEKPKAVVNQNPPRKMKSEEKTSYESLTAKVFDRSNNLVDVRQALLLTKMDLPLGWINLTITFFVDGKLSDEKSYRFVRMNDETWLQDLPEGKKPLVSESDQESWSFKMVDAFPDRSRITRTFKRKGDGSTEIGVHWYQGTSEKPESVVYDGKIITKKEYLKYLKESPPKITSP